MPTVNCNRSKHKEGVDESDPKEREKARLRKKSWWKPECEELCKDEREEKEKVKKKQRKPEVIPDMGFKVTKRPAHNPCRKKDKDC